MGRILAGGWTTQNPFLLMMDNLIIDAQVCSWAKYAKNKFLGTKNELSFKSGVNLQKIRVAKIVGAKIRII